jgi:tRNA (cytidine/uridine-2'-O-)-methyltransferase
METSVDHSRETPQTGCSVQLVRVYSPDVSSSDVPTSAEPLFRVVLHEPEIPNNTGNIGRTCIATGCSLELIKPLGFDVSEKACRRAGLDYWPRLSPVTHESWSAFTAAHSARTSEVASGLWLFTTKGGRPAWEVPLAMGDALVFGKETRGLPPEILASAPDRLVRFPMMPGERSLNLATAVCAAVYEGIRQLASRDEVRIDAGGRLLRLTS